MGRMAEAVRPALYMDRKNGFGGDTECGLEMSCWKIMCF